MKTIRVALKTNPYNIVVGKNILPQLGRTLKRLKPGKDAVIITNPLIRRLYGKTVCASLKKSGFSVKVLEVPDGEKSKSAKVAISLMEEIARYDVFKQVFVVALGGGVIGDLAGYVAAAYKRGVPYVQVPTTFLAQIDSAIGGKVAIDLSVGKNLVGAFYQPKIVFSDVSVLKTLSKRQMKNGLAEAVKYGVIKDAKLFAFLEKNFAKVIAADSKTLSKVIEVCSRIKTVVVVADEKETKGIRTILNFGHTIGHAIEAAGKFRLYQHGEAIALGIRAACAISVRTKSCTIKTAERINALLAAVGLPVTLKKIKQADILRLMRHDKKFISGKNRFVLVSSIGKVKVKEAVPLSVIQSSIQALRK